MMFQKHRRAFTFAPLVAAVAFITACDDDPVAPEDPADAVVTMRLTIADRTVDIGSGDSENVTIPLDEPTSVAAEFLDADGNEVSGLDEEFELNIVPDADEDEIATFERDAANPFAGTLTGDAAGNAVYVAQLFHVAGGHGDFDVHLNLTVE